MSQRHAGALALSLLVSAALAVAPPAALATLSLSTTAAPSFAANFNTGDQTTTYTVPMTAKDTSLITSPGWNLTITSTQLTTTGHTLSTTASAVTGVTSTCASTCTRNPTNSITYPLTVPAAGTPPTAVKFYNAAANTGLGTFTITPTVQVTVPQNSFAGTYTSTLTLAIVSGP
jgi:hypothetical protein